MRHHYRLFGLSAVSNNPIPGLVSSVIAHTDLNIYLGQAPPTENGFEKLTFVSSIITTSGKPAFETYKCDIGWHLVYESGLEFWFDDGGTRIWVLWPEQLTVNDVSPYLLGPVLGLVLRHRGVISLHASAVELNGRAALFLGDPGAGKSTTAAAMARRGHALMSDDIVPLTECGDSVVAIPSYPSIWLWPDSAETLYGVERKLDRVSATYLKRQVFLGQEDHAFQESALPLAAIFILARRSSDARAPFITELSPREGLMALISNSYATRALDTGRRVAEFEFLTRVAGSVPIRRLCAHSDARLLGPLCDLIESACAPISLSHPV